LPTPHTRPSPVITTLRDELDKGYLLPFAFFSM